MRNTNLQLGNAFAAGAFQKVRVLSSDRQLHSGYFRPVEKIQKIYLFKFMESNDKKKVKNSETNVTHLIEEKAMWNLQWRLPAERTGNV